MCLRQTRDAGHAAEHAVTYAVRAVHRAEDAARALSARPPWERRHPWTRGRHRTYLAMRSSSRVATAPSALLSGTTPSYGPSCVSSYVYSCVRAERNCVFVAHFIGHTPNLACAAALPCPSSLPSLPQRHISLLCNTEYVHTKSQPHARRNEMRHFARFHCNFPKSPAQNDAPHPALASSARDTSPTHSRARPPSPRTTCERVGTVLNSTVWWVAAGPPHERSPSRVPEAAHSIQIATTRHYGPLGTHGRGLGCPARGQNSRVLPGDFAQRDIELRAAARSHVLRRRRLDRALVCTLGAAHRRDGRAGTSSSSPSSVAGRWSGWSGR